ncbi:MAG: TIGR03435 family protein [Vicinamibacterales bacterium]
MPRIVAMGLLVGGLIASADIFAQAPAAPEPRVAFDVASVKPNTSNSGFSRSTDQPDGSYSAVNMPLRTLILYAFRLHPVLDRGRVVGAPGWVESERFDVTGRAPANATAEQVWDRLRMLLVERFKLAIHTEAREGPVYALVMADGASAMRPKPSSLDCSIAGGLQTSLGPRSETAVGPGATPPPSPSRCGLSYAVDANGSVVIGGAQSMAALTRILSRPAGRTVIDRTGLTGLYDFVLRWAPEQRPGGSAGGAPTAAAPEGPSLFTALRDQLGMKLEAQRGPVDYLVVDHIERPTPD